MKMNNTNNTGAVVYIGTSTTYNISFEYVIKKDLVDSKNLLILHKDSTIK